MTTKSTDLQPWNDAEDLFRALTRIHKHQRYELQNAVRDLVNHPDEGVRTEAIRKLYVWWTDKESRDQAVAALTHDSHYGVRRVAAFGVASTSDEQTRRDDTRLLLQTFLNESEDIAVRGAAYESLLLMNGRNDFPPVKREIDPTLDVDWGWIAALRAEVDV